MSDAAFYPRCVHGFAIYQRCLVCEQEMALGIHGGFNRQKPCRHKHPDRQPDDVYCRDCGEMFNR